MSRFKRSMVFAAFTAALLCFSWWLQADVGLADPAPFLRALVWLPGAGILLLGLGIFLRRGSTALFLDIVGAVTLVSGLTLFVLYGGMENTYAPGADTAVNLVLCLWTVLPLSFVVYTLILGLNTRDDSRPRRRFAAGISVALAAWLLLLLISGQMLHFVRLEEGASVGKNTPYIATGETMP